MCVGRIPCCLADCIHQNHKFNIRHVGLFISVVITTLMCHATASVYSPTLLSIAILRKHLQITMHVNKIGEENNNHLALYTKKFTHVGLQ